MGVAGASDCSVGIPGLLGLVYCGSVFEKWGGPNPSRKSMWILGKHGIPQTSSASISRLRSCEAATRRAIQPCCSNIPSNPSYLAGLICTKWSSCHWTTSSVTTCTRTGTLGGHVVKALMIRMSNVDKDLFRLWSMISSLYCETMLHVFSFNGILYISMFSFTHCD